MKKWLMSFFIFCYLGILSWGVTSHTLQINTNSHPMMYYIVWDMFCGWSAFDYKLHMIAEGTDGEYYEVAPAPWGEIHPFGSLPRSQYDFNTIFPTTIAQHILEKTDHPPINRIFVIEESWSKRYNIPDDLYRYKFGMEKDPHHYYTLRNVFCPDGTMLTRNVDFENRQLLLQFYENPKMLSLVRSNKPYYKINITKPQPDQQVTATSTFADPASELK